MRNKIAKIVFGLAIAVFCVFLTTIPAGAAINSQINFQGKITNPDGTNIANGNYSIVFSLYNVASVGTAIWAETDVTTVTDGVFQVNLGASCPFLTANVCNNSTPIDFNNSSIYLGIKVGADPEMTPRVAFTASPYAFNSDKVGGLTAAQLLQLSPGSQQTGSINVSGSINTASTLSVQGANALTLGSTTNFGALLFQDGTANNRTITVSSPALTASYGLTLPTTAPTLSQCLQSGSTTASQLIFSSCSGTVVTLQTAYTSGSAGTQVIALTAANLGIKIQDAATTVGTLFSVTSSGGTSYLGVTNTGVSVAALNAGAGLIQTTGGLTATGALSFNATGTAATLIGNVGAPVTITSSGLNVTSAGVISGATGYSQSSGNFAVSGTGTFGTGTGQVALNGATTVTNAIAATTSLAVDSGTITPTTDQVVISNAASAGITTAGVNGLYVNYKGGAAAVESSGMRIDFAPGGTSGGIWSGLRIAAAATGAASGVTEYGIKLEGPTAPGIGTETAIYIGSGWDVGLDIQSGGIQLANQTDPVAPAANNLRLYAKTIAGRVLPKFIGPSGVDTPIQANLGFNRISYMNPAGGTVLTTFVGGSGSLFTNTGTANNPTPLSTNLLTSTRRATFSSGTTAGVVASHRQSVQQAWRGNAAGLGGFFYTIRFGSEAIVAGNRAFVGLSDSVAAPTNVDPTTSTAPGKMGLAINANTGNWKWVNNATGTAPTVVDLGANFLVDTTSLYELIIFCPPNGSTVTYRVTNLSTNTNGNAQVTGTATTNITGNTTFLAPQFWITNNATAAAAILGFGGWYLESDL